MIPKEMTNVIDLDDVCAGGDQVSRRVAQIPVTLILTRPREEAAHEQPWQPGDCIRRPGECARAEAMMAGPAGEK